jgi:dipeptidyl aminopeptidase/acylaminoacyl peptidase
MWPSRKSGTREAVDWAVIQKIVDPQRVAMMGASYGGYSTVATKTG